MNDVSRETISAILESAPEGVAAVFKDNLSEIYKYAELLCTEGIKRGLIGPREAAVIWDRHILNCVAMIDYFPEEATVLDIGTGAGLPAIPLILARPDLRIIALEPLLRRVNFLQEAKEILNISIEIVRGRAEDKTIQRKIGKVDIVTSRAVANLFKLASLAKPYLSRHSKLIALKGDLAKQEVLDNQQALSKLGYGDWEIVQVGGEVLQQETKIVIGGLVR